MSVSRKIRLNLRNFGNLPAIMLSQYDEGYNLIFEIYDGASAADDLSAYTATLKGIRSDELSYSFTGTISTNILTFEIDTTMTGVAGKGTAEIALTASGVVYATFNIPVFIEKAAVPDGSIDADVTRAEAVAEQIQTIVNTAAATVEASLGTLSNLTTTDKSSVVAAINEVDADVSQLSADITDRIDNIVSNGGSTELTYTETNYCVSSGKVTNTSTGKLLYFPITAGKKYRISISGAYNRFCIYYGDTVSVGDSLTTIVFNKYDSAITRANSYTIDSAEDYAYCVLWYNYDGYGTVSNIVIDIEEVNETGFTVGGTRVYTASEVTALNTALSNSVDDKIDDITNGNSIVEVEHTVLDYVVSRGNISNAYSGKIAYFTITSGKKYEISISGIYNRFAVYYGNAVTVGTSLTELTKTTYDSAVQRSDSYTISSAENYTYVVLWYNYDGYGTSSNVSISIKEVTLSGDFTVNGIRVYTAEESDELLSNLSIYPFYTSPNSVEVVTTTAEVYTLYDALVTNYSDYVTKTVLGQDSDSVDICCYQFGNGSYNSSGQRNRDTSVSKPVILIVAGVHGNERSAVMSTYQFFLDMCEGNGKLCNLRENYIFKVIPVVCPYGYDNNARANGNGVNINRNFDADWALSGEGTENYSGASVADQPETQIVQSFIDANTDAILYVDHHNSGYINEVSYLAGDNTLTGMSDFKTQFDKHGYETIPYFTNEEGFADDLIYAYTGNFDEVAMSYEYAQKVGLFSVCLETSLNQNSTGRHGQTTIKAGACVLGNMLNTFADM